MKITQYFTGHGILGVLFSFAGPTLALTGLYLLLNSTTYQYGNGPGLLHIVLIGGGVIMTIVAFPLMLIGREYSSGD